MRRKRLHKLLVKVQGTHTEWIEDYREIYRAKGLGNNIDDVTVKGVVEIIDEMTDHRYTLADVQAAFDYEKKIVKDLNAILLKITDYEHGVSHTKTQLDDLTDHLEDIEDALSLCYLTIGNIDPYLGKVKELKARVEDLIVMFGL